MLFQRDFTVARLVDEVLVMAGCAVEGEVAAGVATGAVVGGVVGAVVGAVTGGVVSETERDGVFGVPVAGVPVVPSCARARDGIAAMRAVKSM
jgi:hypothetical protein